MRPLPSSLLALLGLMLAGASATSNSASSPPSRSAPPPDTELELICHTDNPSECYPKIFQATDEFQIVRPDQDIPKGLHVRLNVQTGQKEAKINVPDEDNPALAGLPVDSSIVIVEPEDGGGTQEHPPQIPKNAPAYDPIGKIKEPKKETPQDAAESTSFSQSLAILKKGLNIDEALEALEEISHDIYYGLKITEDYDTTRQLLCLASTTPPSPSSASASRAKLAALTISSAIQNNPKALAQIERHWPSLRKEICPGGGSSEPLGAATFRLLPLLSSSSSSSSSPPPSPSLTKARISAISGLLKSKLIRSHFLATGGMERLLEVLVIQPNTDSSPEDWEPAQRKAGLLVLDNFLDADMGAVLGEWPKIAQAEDEDCAKKGEVSEQCWDWHAKRIAGREHKGHWSVELWEKLREQRGKLKVKGSGNGNKSRGKDEL